MSYIQDKRIYYVNSANRHSGTHSDFDYKFDIPENKFDSVAVLDMSIPKSYYLIDEKRNTFQITEGTQSATVTILAGNYSSKTFAKHCTQQMNTVSPNHWTYTMVQNNQGKFMYTVTNNTSQPSIVVTTNVYEQLGFEPNTTNTFANNTLQSTNVTDFQRESTLFLRSDMVTVGSGDNVLQQVFAENTTDFDNITYKCDDTLAMAKPFVINSGNTYHFYLTDENGARIETNGRNMVFTLMLFKRSTANENLNEFIKFAVNFMNEYRRSRN